MNEYLQDGTYREVQRARARLSYWRNRPLVARTSPEVFKSGLSVKLTIKDKRDSRYGNSVTTPVFKIGSVAEVMQMTPQAVKLWEERGWLPKSTFTLATNGNQNVRGYTFDQLYAIWYLSPLLNFSDKRGTEFSPFVVGLKEMWKQMPDGVWLVPSVQEEHDEQKS